MAGATGQGKSVGLNAILTSLLYKKHPSQLKFVLGNIQEQWDEMDSVVEQFRDLGIDWPVWIMPVGAREEEQQSSAGEVAEMAFKRGYNVAARVHVYLFGNAIGT